MSNIKAGKEVGTSFSLNGLKNNFRKGISIVVILSVKKPLPRRIDRNDSPGRSVLQCSA